MIYSVLIRCQYLWLSFLQFKLPRLVIIKWPMTICPTVWIRFWMKACSSTTQINVFKFGAFLLICLYTKSRFSLKNQLEWTNEYVKLLICCWIILSSWLHLVPNIIIQLLIGFPLELAHNSIYIFSIYIIGVLSGKCFENIFYVKFIIFANHKIKIRFV